MKERRGAENRPCSVAQQKSSCFHNKSKTFKHLRTFIVSFLFQNSTIYTYKWLSGDSRHCEGAGVSVLQFCLPTEVNMYLRSSSTHSQCGLIELQWSDEDGHFFFSCFSLSVLVSLWYGSASVWMYFHMYSHSTTINRLSCWDRSCFQLSFLLHALPVHPSSGMQLLQ